MAYPVDWDTRPRIAPPSSKTDKIIEVIALTGVLLSIAIVIYSAIALPDVIPNHYQQLGGIGIYWSKLLVLAILAILTVSIFALFTVFYRFPYMIQYPVIVTEENAPGLYGKARSTLCILNAIIIWMVLTLELFFVILI